VRGDGILIIRLTSIRNWPINVSSITTVQMEKENYNRRGFLSPGAFSWGLYDRHSGGLFLVLKSA